MTGLMLLAMLQVAPQDTVVVRVPIPQPQVEQARDTTIVSVDVTPVSDSILAGVARAQLALNDAIRACGCSDSGTPEWFYAGILTLSTLFLYRYWQTTGSDDDVLEDDAPVEPQSEPEPQDPCSCRHCRGPGG